MLGVLIPIRHADIATLCDNIHIVSGISERTMRIATSHAQNLGELRCELLTTATLTILVLNNIVSILAIKSDCKVDRV